MTSYDEEMPMDVTYEFTIKGKTSPDYQCCVSIIKGFGKKPVADVYVDNLNYTSDFDNNKPNNVNSVIICYLKGNANNAYLKMCELTDYLIQQFEENEDFRELDYIVRYTYIRNVRIQVNPNSKVYGVLCAFELEHKLY